MAGIALLVVVVIWTYQRNANYTKAWDFSQAEKQRLQIDRRFENVYFGASTVNPGTIFIEGKVASEADRQVLILTVQKDNDTGLPIEFEIEIKSTLRPDLPAVGQ